MARILIDGKEAKVTFEEWKDGKNTLSLTVSFEEDQLELKSINEVEEIAHGKAADFFNARLKLFR